jgi:tRNA nucleotidyltransferase (CCA-adding enzyme)
MLSKAVHPNRIDLTARPAFSFKRGNSLAWRPAYADRSSKKQSMSRIPNDVVKALNRLNALGYEAVIVGGCVRDSLLSRRPQDWDVATSATPDEILRIFPRCHPTGIKHGTVTAVIGKRTVEITTFRQDGRYPDHRRPESVAFVTDLLEDLSRRDFTINAMAQDAAGTLIDPFNGIADLQNRVIRCVGQPEKRFKEDALRMFRAFRFSAVLGFRIEPDTLRALQSLGCLTGDLSAERIRSELEKILLSDRPETLDALIGCGLLSAYIPNAQPVSCLPLRRLPKSKLHRLAGFTAILINAGAVQSAQEFLKKLKYGRSVIPEVLSGLNLSQTGIDCTAPALKRLIAKAGPTTALCAASIAEATGAKGCVGLMRKILRGPDCVSLRQLAVSGTDLVNLGYSGREIGLLLRALLEHVLDNPQDNHADIC